jgi:hypothetical protein
LIRGSIYLSSAIYLQLLPHCYLLFRDRFKCALSKKVLLL